MSQERGKDCCESVRLRMSDEAALLRAIREHPDEDTPRLVYADWLQEYGDDEDRAAFIRLECELARLPPADRRRSVLLQRRRTLWEAHKGRWRAAVPHTRGVRVYGEATARGF